MTSPTPATCGRLFEALAHLMRARRRMLEHNPDINFTTLVLLGSVASMNGPRISALADALLVDISVVSRQVAALESDGLLRRVPDEHDRRATRIELTEAGDAQLAVYRTRTSTDLAALLGDFTDTEIADLAGRLDAVSGAMCTPAAGPAAAASDAAPHPAPHRRHPPGHAPPSRTAAPTPTDQHHLESVTR